jgi:hypothetical protein
VLGSTDGCQCVPESRAGIACRNRVPESFRPPVHPGAVRAGTRAALAVGATAAAATVAVTKIAGTGYGWIGALSTPISSQNWSITGVLGRWTADLLAHDDMGAALAISLWRWAGVLATLIVAALVWTYRHRLGPLYGLGIVLVALVIFGPALRPWYVIWGLIPLAAAARHQRVCRLLRCSAPRWCRSCCRRAGRRRSVVTRTSGSVWGCSRPCRRSGP